MNKLECDGIVWYNTTKINFGGIIVNTKFSRILFDYDGTLIIHDKANEGEQIATILGLPKWQVAEFEARLTKYFSSGYTIYGKKVTYDHHYGNLERQMGPLEEFGITAKQLDDAITEKSIRCARLAQGAKETLEYLASKGYQLCLFTNGFYKGQVENMKYKGIYEYFEKVYAWDNFYAKPDKRAFMRALGNTSAMNTVMIGDSLHADIIPAKQMGIYTVGINLGTQDLTEDRPDKVISNLSELRQIL